MSCYKKERDNPPPDEPKTPPGKKDTKRWCRGKVGVEHVKGWAFRGAWHTFSVESCGVCGKKFRHCWRWRPDQPCICGLDHHVRA